MAGGPAGQPPDHPGRGLAARPSSPHSGSKEADRDEAAAVLTIKATKCEPGPKGYAHTGQQEQEWIQARSRVTVWGLFIYSEN